MRRGPRLALAAAVCVVIWAVVAAGLAVKWLYDGMYGASRVGEEENVLWLEGLNLFLGNDWRGIGTMGLCLLMWTLLPLVPVLSIGCFFVLVLSANLMQCRTCPAAGRQLAEELLQAREELTKKGFIFDKEQTGDGHKKCL
eukprot:GHVQ01025538.1.p1 GENE.GHVQ01025538.1~~GHVQ01025538.1.p1  ORF type:complete len:141 (-),score=22.86 GHVQ01025538.1:1077-1499(-)